MGSGRAVRSNPRGSSRNQARHRPIVMVVEDERSSSERAASDTAWLVMSVGENRQHGGNDGYDDDPAVHYSWDDTVPNHGQLRIGDVIALWDKEALLGVSVIEAVDVGAGRKVLHSCPDCGMAGIKARRTRSPRYKCYKCKHEFDTPHNREVDVVTYRSDHGSAWVELPGSLRARHLRALCEHPDSQLSLRRLRWAAFRGALSEAGLSLPMTILNATADQVRGGHRVVTVRARLGQAEFRGHLLERFGATCAFTGACHPSALDAAHLYSFAQVGRHHSHGGLLLRSDLHRLFDLGYIAIDPVTGCLDISDALRGFPDYAALSGRRPLVELNEEHREWLILHWEEHRGAGARGQVIGV